MKLDKERLAKFMSMTGSGHDAEALAAIRKANQLLRNHKTSWADVLGVSSPPIEAPVQRQTSASQSRPVDARPRDLPPNYQITRLYRNAFRREPFLSRLLGFPFWIVVELLAVFSPNRPLDTKGPVITIVFAVSMLLALASWIGLGYILLFSVA